MTGGGGKKAEPKHFYKLITAPVLSFYSYNNNNNSGKKDATFRIGLQSATRGFHHRVLWPPPPPLCSSACRFKPT